MLDDGVNDAWYKSECGQACGFGGEKFKWLVRMVLLHPFIPRAALPLSVAPHLAPNPKSPFNNPATFRTSAARISLATRYQIDAALVFSFDFYKY